MASRTTVVRLAVEGIQANITALNRMGDEGQRALQKLGGGAVAANQNMERLDKSVNNISRGGRSNIFQNLGYQVNDFAVQLQGGTAGVTAFTQQFSQFIGAMGPAGAVVGATTAVLGGLYTYLTRAGDGADKAAEELTKLTEGTKSYGDMLQAIQPLQETYLENEVRAKNAVEDHARALAQIKIARAGAVPLSEAGLGEGGAQFGGQATKPSDKLGPLNIPVEYGPQTLDVANAQRRAALAEEQKAAGKRGEIEQAITAMHASRNQEDIDTADYIYRRAKQQLEDNKTLVQAHPNSMGRFYDTKFSGASVTSPEVDRPGEEAQKRREKATAAAKSAAATAETLRIANEKLLETAKLNTQAAQDELDAIYMGEDARKRANVEREYELKLLEAAQPAHKANQLALIDEANALRDLKLATIERSRAMEDAQKKIDASPGGVGGHGMYGETAAKAQADRQQLQDYGKKQLTQDEKDFARIQEDILTEPWRNLATNVSQITTDMFDEILTKGKVSFQSLATGIGDMFKTTITGALGNITAAPVNMLAAKFAQPGGFDWGSLTQGQQYGVAAGVGGAAGYAAGSLLGPKGSYAGVGGGIGGAVGAGAGAAIGSAFPVVGTVAGGMIGGALGTMAGSFIGGMFGGEGLGNDQSVQKFGSKVAKAIWSDQSFSEENRQVTSGIIGQLGQLSEALKATGANINDIQLAISAGNKTGIQVGGKGYGTDADAAAAAAIRILLQNTSGLQGSEQTALRKTRGRNVQEVMEDLAFAKEFDKITFAGTQSEAAMRDLTEQFDALGRRARALGLDEMALAATRERAMAQLTLAAQRQARDLGAQFQMAIASTDLERGIIGVNQQFAGLNDALTDAGYSAENLAQLEGARVAAEGQVRAQAAAQAQAEAEARAQQAAAAAQQRQAEAEARRQQAIQDAEARKQAARQARSLLAQYSQTITQSDLERTIIGINEQFATLRDTMKDAGYNAAGFAQVEKARVRAVKEAQEQDRRSRRDLLAQYLDATGTSELERTLRGIDLEFVHLTETLKAAGYNSAGLAEVEKARVRAQADAIKEAQRQTQDLQRDMESRILGIGSFYDQLIAPLEAINQNSMLNPAGQIGAARQAFQADLGGAGARDPEAIRRLAGSAQQYQQLLQQNYGTGGLGGQGLRDIQGGISGTIAGLQQERAAALADLPQIVQKTTLDIIRENRADIDRVVEQLELLRRDLRGRGIAA